MTTPQPQRREFRRTHLDASVMPVERALLARVEAISTGVMELFAIRGDLPLPIDAEALAANVRLDLAQEFRALAEELHWW